MYGSKICQTSAVFQILVVRIFTLHDYFLLVATVTRVTCTEGRNKYHIHVLEYNISGFSHVLENLENLDNYDFPGMSWKSPEKTQFFRLSWNSGILIKMSWKSPGISLVHGIWISMVVFQWPVCYFSSCFVHYTVPWKTGILKGAICINKIIRCYVLRNLW